MLGKHVLPHHDLCVREIALSHKMAGSKYSSASDSYCHHKRTSESYSARLVLRGAFNAVPAVPTIEETL